MKKNHSRKEEMKITVIRKKFFIKDSKTKLLIALLGLSFGVSAMAMEKKEIWEPKELAKWLREEEKKENYELKSDDLKKALSSLDGRDYDPKKSVSKNFLKELTKKIIEKVKNLPEKELEIMKLSYAAIGLVMAGLEGEAQKLLSSVGNKMVPFDPEDPDNKVSAIDFLSQKINEAQRERPVAQAEYEAARVKIAILLKEEKKKLTEKKKPLTYEEKAQQEERKDNEEEGHKNQFSSMNDEKANGVLRNISKSKPEEINEAVKNISLDKALRLLGEDFSAAGVEERTKLEALFANKGVLKGLVNHIIQKMKQEETQPSPTAIVGAVIALFMNGLPEEGKKILSVKKDNLEKFDENDEDSPQIPRIALYQGQMRDDLYQKGKSRTMSISDPYWEKYYKACDEVREVIQDMVKESKSKKK